MAKRILIIEDDQAIAEIERDYLELSQFEVTLANDGGKGLELALNEAFDLILLDVMLPTVDGFSILKKLRETLDIPILMVTAKQEDIDKIRGLGLGADDYIEKPFSPSILVARVKANIAQYERLRKGQSTNKGEADIQVGHLLIQPGSHRVFVHN
ncbi:response regulator transcription factor, partial [Veillonella seminalis]